jgi:hypothetical protein
MFLTERALHVSPKSRLLHGLIYFLLLLIVETAKVITHNNKVMVTNMYKLQKSIRAALISVCNKLADVLRATVWAFGAEVGVVTI